MGDDPGYCKHMTFNMFERMAPLGICRAARGVVSPSIWLDALCGELITGGAALCDPALDAGVL